MQDNLRNTCPSKMIGSPGKQIIGAARGLWLAVAPALAAKADEVAHIGDNRSPQRHAWQRRGKSDVQLLLKLLLMQESAPAGASGGALSNGRPARKLSRSPSYSAGSALSPSCSSPR